MFCLPKEPIPCVRYNGDNQDEVDAFLIANGGTAARYDSVGEAQVATIIKGDTRFIYLRPGSYLRRLDFAQFTALSSKVFKQNYRVIPQSELVLIRAELDLQNAQLNANLQGAV